MDPQENILTPEELAALQGEAPQAATAAETAGPSAAAPTPPAGKRMQERRNHHRHHLRWRAALQLVSDKAAYQGQTINISTLGCTLLVDYNIAPQGKVRLHLQVLPRRFGAQLETLTLDARIMHTSYSGQYQGFLLGIAFLPSSAAGINRLSTHLGSGKPAQKAAA